MFAVVREWEGIEAVFSSKEKAEAYLADAIANDREEKVWLSIEPIELDPVHFSKKF